ncbi:unnamed protein product [Prunus armeniaca]
MANSSNSDSTQTINTTLPNSTMNPFSSFTSVVNIKLDRTNYPLWLAQILPILRSRDLMGYVDGTIVCPSQQLSGSTTTNPAYTTWVQYDQMILSWINGSLTPSVLSVVASKRTSSATWEALEQRYASTSQNRILFLRNELLQTKKGDLLVADYLDKMNAISDNLALAGKPVGDDELVQIILNNLGPAYECRGLFLPAANRLGCCKRWTEEIAPFCLAKYQNLPFYPSCFRCSNSAHGVGASKEGSAPLSRFLPSLILLELLERYTHFGHRDLLVLLVDHKARLLLVMSLNFKLHVPIMASGNPPFIIRDHLYSVDDRLKRGRPPPLLKGADEDVIIDEEPAPEATSVIDPASVSRCCIERGLFPAVPLFFQYPCSISKGWSEWVDAELKSPSTRDILSRAGVLEAIFASKACDIHIEAKTLRHLVRRWSTETHTFICSWGEFTPTLEDVANIFHLPLCGSQDPFHIALTAEDGPKLEILRKGAPTSPSTSLRFSNWIQFFGNSDRDEPCRLAAFVSLWLGRFLFCDFSQDCLHGRVFPLALAIARGSMIPLAPMFLGHLYRLLDQIQFLEKGAAGTMAVETFVNSSFLQIFLWERFKGIEVSPLPYSKAESLVASDENSYVPGSLPLICRWFRRMQRKGQNFLELLDDVEQFIFRPYCASSEGFRSMPLYADSAALMEALAMPTQGCQLRREALLSAACLPLPTFGDDHLETSVHYSPYRVRRQLGFDQGVPSRPNHGDSLSLHRVFWTGDSVPGDGRPLALALASRKRVGGLSKAYQNYWNRCFASLSRFHAAHCDRLIPTIIHHARLVSEEKAISLSEKRNLPFISKSGEIVGDFSKLKRKLEKSGSHSAGKSVVHGSARKAAAPRKGKL